MALILPVDIDFEDWTKYLQYELTTITIPIYKKENSWQEWVLQLIQINNFNSNFPLPSDKELDWKKWGAQFIIYSETFLV